MKIDSNASLVYKNQFTGSDTSTQRIKKAVDTAGENSPFELQLQQSGSLDSPNSQSFKMPLSLSRVYGPGRGDGVVHLEDVVKFADAAMKDAKNQLDSAFASAGIRNSPAVNFTFDRQGQIVVGDHPQKEQIQKLLSENDGLRHDVGRAMAIKENAVLLQRGDRVTEAYYSTYRQKGPAAAQALLERDMAIGYPKSSFSCGDSGFVGLFNGKPEQEYLASIMNSLGVGNGVRVDGFA